VIRCSLRDSVAVLYAVGAELPDMVSVGSTAGSAGGRTAPAGRGAADGRTSRGIGRSTTQRTERRKIDFTRDAGRRVPSSTTIPTEEGLQ